MSSTGSDAEVRQRILRNARAAEWERLRNEAARQWPALDPDQLDAKARELQREKLSAAGRKGRELQLARMAEADAVLAKLPGIELRLLEALDFIRHGSPDDREAA